MIEWLSKTEKKWQKNDGIILSKSIELQFPSFKQIEWLTFQYHDLCAEDHSLENEKKTASAPHIWLHKFIHI